MVRDLDSSENERNQSDPPADNNSSIPKQLGDYRIIRELGRGGMGVVYEAEQVSLGRHVALKVLPSAALPDDKHVRRFVREAKSAAKLHHTNIVPVFGVGEQDGLHYYVMQFIQGLPLNKVIEELKKLDSQPTGESTSAILGSDREDSRRENSEIEAARRQKTKRFGDTELVPDDTKIDADEDVDKIAERVAERVTVEEKIAASRLSELLVQSDSISGPGELLASPDGQSSQHQAITYWSSVATLGRQVANALQHAHDQQILHRDIKPSNLLLDRQGATWITDFGLARATDQQDITQAEDIMGTLRYMPPEAFDGKADARSDVYSLGLTLYEMLAFQPAYGGRDRQQLLRQVSTEAAPRLDQVNPKAPRDLVTIVHKAIECEPAHRYQTADDMARDLRHFLHDEPIEARRVSAWERLVRWSRRNRELAASLSTIAILLIVGLFGSVLMAAHFQHTAVEYKKVATKNKSLADRNAKLAQTNQETSEAAIETLYRGLLREAEAVRLNKQPGYRERVLSLLREAVALPVEDQDINELRRHTIACMGDRLARAPIVIEGLAGNVLRASISPDDAEVGVILEGEIAQIYHLRTGEELYHSTLEEALPDRDWLTPAPSPRIPKMKVDGTIKYAALSGNRKLLAHVVAPKSEGVNKEQILELHLWNVSTRTHLPVARPGLHHIHKVQFSPNNRYIACACLEGLAVYSTETMQEVGFIRGRQVSDIEWTPDSEFIAYTSFHEGNVHLWSLSHQRDIAVFSPKNQLRVEQIGRFSSDGSRMVAFGPGSVHVWDLSPTSEKMELHGHEAAVTGLQFSSDGSWLASTCKDGLVRVWNATNGQLATQLNGLPGLGQSIAVSPDGRLIASSDYKNGTALIWDRPSGRVLTKINHRGLGSRVHKVAFSPDGKMLAVGAVPGLLVFRIERIQEDTTDNFEIRLTPIENPPPAKFTVGDLCFSKNNRYLAWATNSGEIHIWDLKNGVELTSPGEVFSRIQSLSFSPEGSLVYLDPYQNVVAWNVVKAREELSFSAIQETSDTSGSKTRKTTLSADGKWIAISSVSGRQATVWDLETKTKLFELPEAETTVYWMAWSPDKTQLAISQADGTTAIWNIPIVKSELAKLDLAW